MKYVTSSYAEVYERIYEDVLQDVDFEGIQS